MAVKRKEVKNKQETEKVQLIDEVGQDLNMIIATSRLNLEILENIQSLDETKQISVIADILEATVVEWDMLEDDESVTPITLEYIKKIPLVTLNWIVEGIMDSQKIEKKR